VDIVKNAVVDVVEVKERKKGENRRPSDAQTYGRQPRANFCRRGNSNNKLLHYANIFIPIESHEKEREREHIQEVRSSIVCHIHTMSARPPPARPHIGLNPHLSSFGTSSEWAEDDAWDSASDSESPHFNKSWNNSRLQSTPPKNVPGKVVRSSSSSSSNLASSFTHIHAPNPSSYPPKPDLPPLNKGGWTLVEASGDKDQKSPLKNLRDSDIDHDTLVASTTSQVVDELVVGDFDDPVVLQGPALKAKVSRSSVREQVDEIVAGASGNPDPDSAFSDIAPPQTHSTY